MIAIYVFCAVIFVLSTIMLILYFLADKAMREEIVDLQRKKVDKRNCAQCKPIDLATGKEIKLNAIDEFAGKLLDNRMEVKSQEFGYMRFVTVETIEEIMQEYTDENTKQ